MSEGEPASRYIMPPRIAHWLEIKAGITADWRDRLRDTDLEAHQVMAKLHWAATQHRSDIGTKVVGRHSGQTQSEAWLTAKQAAAELHVTDRCIRKWCHTGRLPAIQPGANWLIHRNDIDVFKLSE